MPVKKKDSSAFSIAAAYIGTVVGAGFASGQEILQFFGYFGKNGFYGIVLITVFFMYFGLAVLRLGAQLNAASHKEIVHSVSGRSGAKIIDYTITFFLFGGTAAMFAGSGAVFAEIYKLPFWIGAILMLVLTTVTVLGGAHRVVASIGKVVPFLLGAVIVTGIYALYNANEIWTKSGYEHLAVFPSWIIMSILYISYNMTLAVPILAVMGAQVKEDGKLFYGAILGGAGLGFGAFAALSAVLGFAPFTLTKKIPLLYAAKQISPLFADFFVLVLLAEIYTTAVSNLYGFTARIFPGAGAENRRKIILSAISAFAASLAGFVSIVRFLYPLAGAAGLLLLAGLAWREIRLTITHNE